MNSAIPEGIAGLARWACGPPGERAARKVVEDLSVSCGLGELDRVGAREVPQFSTRERRVAGLPMGRRPARAPLVRSSPISRVIRLFREATQLKTVGAGMCAVGIKGCHVEKQVHSIGATGC